MRISNLFKGSKPLLLISSCFLVSCSNNQPNISGKRLGLESSRQYSIKVLESTENGSNNEKLSCLYFNTNMISLDQLNMLLSRRGKTISQSDLTTIRMRESLGSYDITCYYRLTVAELTQSDLESIIRKNQDDYLSESQSFEQEKSIELEESRKRQELYNQEQEQIRQAKEADEQRKKDSLDRELNDIIR